MLCRWTLSYHLPPTFTDSSYRLTPAVLEPSLQDTAQHTCANKEGTCNQHSLASLQACMGPALMPRLCVFTLNCRNTSAAVWASVGIVRAHS